LHEMRSMGRAPLSEAFMFVPFVWVVRPVRAFDCLEVSEVLPHFVVDVYGGRWRGRARSWVGGEVAVADVEVLPARARVGSWAVAVDLTVGG